MRLLLRLHWRIGLRWSSVCYIHQGGSGGVGGWSRCICVSSGISHLYIVLYRSDWPFMLSRSGAAARPVCLSHFPSTWSKKVTRLRFMSGMCYESLSGLFNNAGGWITIPQHYVTRHQARPEALSRRQTPHKCDIKAETERCARSSKRHFVSVASGLVSRWLLLKTILGFVQIVEMCLGH